MQEVIEAFGMKVRPFHLDELVDRVFAGSSSEGQAVLCGANLHALCLYYECREFAELHVRPNTLVMIDGMPIVWLLRLLGHRVTRDQRTTWADWFERALARAAADGRSVFIIGYQQDVLDAAIAKANANWPSLRISGTNGYFDMSSADATEVVRKANDFKPDFLVVGMGMPRQEQFVLRFSEQLNAPFIGLAGAAVAYFAGFEATPPRWMGRWGLEWSHRLFVNPRRMAYRYMIEPFKVGFYVSKHLLRAGTRKNGIRQKI